LASELTKGFTKTDLTSLIQAISSQPKTLRVFRLLLGLTVQEFAAASKIISQRSGLQAVGASRIKSMEAGSGCSEGTARCCAVVVEDGMDGRLFASVATLTVRPKINKPDTAEGWKTVQGFAAQGVPLAVFLHQRHYGGAFRQILDATSSRRGDILEDAVEESFVKANITSIRTGSHNQEEIGRRFGVTIRPAPDFVVFDANNTLRALLECKVANDGGTARDKAGRYANLLNESQRLGGVPLFAVLAGLGWARTSDALGPVVRDTDGRVFTLPTLPAMLEVQPFPELSRP
jgi:hypothetical protein